MKQPPQESTTLRGNRRGFTMVEILVAISLLSVSLIGLSSFSFFAARSVHDSKTRALGTVLAREHIDALRTQDFDNLTVGTSADTARIGGWEFTVLTIVEAKGDALKAVTVAVADQNHRVVQSFTTMRGAIQWGNQ